MDGIIICESESFMCGINVYTAWQHFRLSLLNQALPLVLSILIPERNHPFIVVITHNDPTCRVYYYTTGKIYLSLDHDPSYHKYGGVYHTGLTTVLHDF